MRRTRSSFARAVLLDGSFPLPLDRPFTTAAATSCGLTHEELQELTELRLLRRPIRGVYVAAQLHDSRELRRDVLALATPPGSVLTDWSACYYWTGVDRPNADLEEPTLSVFRRSGQPRLRNALVVGGERRFLRDDLVAISDGLSVTTPVRTAWDLGRFFPPVVALGGMDALARLGVFLVSELVADVERFRRQRGVVQLRWLAPFVDPRSESPGESALRLRWLQTSGLPRPELQIPVRDEYGVELFRIDLGVEELAFGAEYDGEQWHDHGTAAHDRARRSRLDEEFGWTMRSFRRPDVFGQHQAAGAVLLEGLREARTRQGKLSARRTGSRQVRSTAGGSHDGSPPSHRRFVTARHPASGGL